MNSPNMSRAKQNELTPGDHQGNGHFESLLGARLTAMMKFMAHRLIGPNAPDDRRNRLLRSLISNAGEKERDRICREPSPSHSNVKFEEDEDEIIDQIAKHLAVNPTTRGQLGHLIASNIFCLPCVESALAKTLTEEFLRMGSRKSGGLHSRPSPE